MLYYVSGQVTVLEPGLAVIAAALVTVAGLRLIPPPS